MDMISDDHGGVTDESLEAYVRGLGGTGLLNPLVPGQNSSGTQFQSGTSGPQPAPRDETQDGPAPVQDEPDLDEYEEGEDEDEPDDDVPGEGGDDGEQEPEPEREPEPAPAPPAEFFEVTPGQFLTREQAQAYINFDRAVAQDPELRSLIEDHYRGRAGQGAGSGSSPSLPAPPSLSEEDLQDPVVRALWETAEQQRQLLAAQQQQLSQVNDIVYRQTMQDNEARVSRIAQEFALAHELNDDQAKQVALAAGRMQLVSTLSQGVDPLTSQPFPADPEAIIRRALDIAYYSIPEFREKELQAQVVERAKDVKRKKRLAGIGGSSGTQPRVTPVPNSQHERLAAATADLSRMMYGEQES